MSEDILARIAAYKREEVALARGRGDSASFAAASRAAGAPRGCLAALGRDSGPGRPALIAEIKKASPSRGVIRTDFDPVALARAYEAGGATCLSVLTDGPSFAGRPGDLRAARAATALPCLRKDFLVDPWQIGESRAMGADAVLVILAMVDDRLARELMDEAANLGMDVLVETHDEAQIDRAARLGATLIGINNRDLRTFVTDLGTTERLGQKTPANALIVSESGIFTAADASRAATAGASAILVGESLMRESDVAGAARALLARS
ncbi:MAG: indole-3-glycerol phosphate synthase TrpC [Caulobacteraceae bacterium]